MMKLCFLSHEYPKPGLNPGGVGVFLKTYLPELAKLGHEVTVLGANNTNLYEETFDQGVRIIRLPNPKTPLINWLLIAKNIKRKIIELSPDLVEGSELSFAFLPKISNIKYVIRLHGGHHFFSESENRNIDPWRGFQEKRSFKKADGFIAVSDYVKRHTSKFLSFHHKPVALIRYFIDTTTFTFSPISTNPNPYSLVFVGTVCEKKGVGNLVKAVEILKESCPSVQLDIYGKDWYFPNGQSYKEFIKNQLTETLRKCVKIHEPVPHERIPDIYKSAEFCIFPSFMETQGLVAPEAMAMGKMVIFTDKGPGPETIEHGVNGFLCNPLEINSIVETIQLAFDSRFRKEEISKAALCRVNEVFGKEKNLLENVKFYQKLIHG